MPVTVGVRIRRSLCMNWLSTISMMAPTRQRPKIIARISSEVPPRAFTAKPAVRMAPRKAKLVPAGSTAPTDRPHLLALDEGRDAGDEHRHGDEIGNVLAEAEHAADDQGGRHDAHDAREDVLQCRDGARPGWWDIVEAIDEASRVRRALCQLRPLPGYTIPRPAPRPMQGYFACSARPVRLIFIICQLIRRSGPTDSILDEVCIKAAHVATHDVRCTIASSLLSRHAGRKPHGYWNRLCQIISLQMTAEKTRRYTLHSRKMRRYTRHRRNNGAWSGEDYVKLRRYTRHKHFVMAQNPPVFLRMNPRTNPTDDE